jgi:hypothetical protein
MAIYPVLARARVVTDDPTLDILEGLSYLPLLIGDMRHWLSLQSANELLYFDYRGVRAITVPYAVEAGPMLMQTVARDDSLRQRHPAYQIDNLEHAHTFALVFAFMNWSALALLEQPVERSSTIVPLDTLDSSTVAVLGTLTTQMEEILLLANRRRMRGEFLTSEMLSELPFLEAVSATARSKRLTELYERRLLALLGKDGRERRFIPTWRLGDQQPGSVREAAVPLRAVRQRRRSRAHRAAGILHIKPALSGLGGDKRAE